VTFVNHQSINQSMSPIEHTSDEAWLLIGAALTTQCEKTKEGRGRDRMAKGISKKDNVAIQKRDVAIQRE
jgi:hypothetical protein